MASMSAGLTPYEPHFQISTKGRIARLMVPKEKLKIKFLQKLALLKFNLIIHDSNRLQTHCTGWDLFTALAMLSYHFNVLLTRILYFF